MDAINQLQGVWNIVPTPFHHDEELDLPSLRTLTDFVVGSGVDGMTILGVLDDKHELRPFRKFTGQLLIAALVAAAGVRITLFVPSLAFSTTFFPFVFSTGQFQL